MFIDDFSVPSMIYAIIIRSPENRGSLEEIKCPKLPNYCSLITAKDIPGINEIDDFPVPVLARENLSYIGEPVGLLTGPDPVKLEIFAEKCLVKTCNPPETGAKPDLTEDVEPSFRKIMYSSTDPENTGSMPSLIVSGSYTTGIQEHWYSEPPGAAAYFDDGKLIVHTATQWPFHVKRSLSKVLKIPETSIEVIQTEPGLHLDGKIISPTLLSCQAALAALITEKPVKIKLRRHEDFRWSSKRSGSSAHIASSLGQKGEVINTEIHLSLDLGSQDIFSAEILNQACLGCMGLYKLGHVNLEGIALKTNKPPQGPMEGFGLSQGFFVSERHASQIADNLRQDPAEWRKKNCYSGNEKLAMGIPLKDGIPMTPLIDSAAAMSDYYRKWASYELLRHSRKGQWDLAEHEDKRGIGIAVAYQGSGFLFPGKDKGLYSVELTLGKDSSLEIRTSVMLDNRENSAIWNELAKSILGVEEDHVTIINTGSCPDSGPSCLSRNITAVTRLVERCCEAIRKQRFRDPLPITVRRSTRPDKFIPWNGINGEQPADLLAFSRPAWGAAVVEIEIDNISLSPIVRGIWLAAEGGKILSQSRARRSLKIAAINALSWSTREQVIYQNGIIKGETIRNYDMPAPEEIPPIFIDFLWNDNSNPKGIGELPYSCIPAAFVQAVSQAMDHPFDKIPLRAEEIWEVKKNKKVEIEK